MHRTMGGTSNIAQGSTTTSKSLIRRLVNSRGPTAFSRGVAQRAIALREDGSFDHHGQLPVRDRCVDLVPLKDFSQVGERVHAVESVQDRVQLVQGRVPQGLRGRLRGFRRRRQLLQRRVDAPSPAVGEARQGRQQVQERQQAAPVEA